MLTIPPPDSQKRYLPGMIDGAKAQAGGNCRFRIEVVTTVLGVELNVFEPIKEGGELRVAACRYEPCSPNTDYMTLIIAPIALSTKVKTRFIHAVERTEYSSH